MENMPYRDELAATATTATTTVFPDTDWQSGLPVKVGTKVGIRELRLSDAQALFAMLSTDEVGKFISPPPATLEGFERFIVWTHRERQEGRYACFAVVPHGCDHAVGIFQIRQLDFNFETAEWGFALGSEYWGSGVFTDAGRLVLDFVFGTLNVHRLEARSALGNGRGNSAILKLGAVHEGVLRKAFLRNGKYHDQNMWSILDEDWYAARQLLPR
jgi:[ribosomal protein S5]-alanine N-acetyltransferase